MISICETHPPAKSEGTRDAKHQHNTCDCGKSTRRSVTEAS